MKFKTNDSTSQYTCIQGIDEQIFHNQQDCNTTCSQPPTQKGCPAKPDVSCKLHGLIHLVI